MLEFGLIWSWWWWLHPHFHSRMLINVLVGLQSLVFFLFTHALLIPTEFWLACLCDCSLQRPSPSGWSAKWGCWDGKKKCRIIMFLCTCNLYLYCWFMLHICRYLRYYYQVNTEVFFFVHVCVWISYYYQVDNESNTLLFELLGPWNQKTSCEDLCWQRNRKKEGGCPCIIPQGIVLIATDCCVCNVI